MTIEEVKLNLKNGKRVRCKDWPNKEYIWYHEQQNLYIYFPYGILDEQSFDIVDPNLWEIIK